VCSLLAKGECVEELAEKLRITPNTARTHIKRIFGKTGATRQVELVKLIMNTTKLRRDSWISPTAAARHEIGKFA
ncbi:MAG: helix-turn-helix transcriptional regulator, partial [Alphaproteobacteria bacterium]